VSRGNAGRPAACDAAARLADLLGQELDALQAATGQDEAFDTRATELGAALAALRSLAEAVEPDDCLARDRAQKSFSRAKREHEDAQAARAGAEQLVPLLGNRTSSGVLLEAVLIELDLALDAASTAHAELTTACARREGAVATLGTLRQDPSQSVESAPPPGRCESPLDIVSALRWLADEQGDVPG
jgi:hypothetical protein